MKKEYKKPYLAVESFQLTAALAVACSVPVASDGKYYLPSGETVFDNALSCTFDLEWYHGEVEYINGPLLNS